MEKMNGRGIRRLGLVALVGAGILSGVGNLLADGSSYRATANAYRLLIGGSLGEYFAGQQEGFAADADLKEIKENQERLMKEHEARENGQQAPQEVLRNQRNSSGRSNPPRPIEANKYQGLEAAAEAKYQQNMRELRRKGLIDDVNFRDPGASSQMVEGYYESPQRNIDRGEKLFFTCEGRRDINQDGFIDYPKDFQNIGLEKCSVNETFLFSAVVINQAGHKLKYELFKDGRKIYTDILPLKGDVSFDVEPLRMNLGAGVYSIVWFLDDEVINGSLNRCKVYDPKE